jgi:Putative auto-transporter adhesin, head GIN domain
VQHFYDAVVYLTSKTIISRKVFIMKNIIVLSVICFFTLCSCFGPRVRGNGTAKTETRELSSFESIVCDGGYDIQVTCGEKQSVSIETDENLLPLIQTVVRDNELRIDTKKNLSPTDGIQLTISVPRLSDFTIDGSAKGFVKNINGGSFHITGNGSTRMALSGNADKLKININGSGTITADSLTAQNSDVHIEGSGDIRCHVINSLDVHIDGSGTVKYIGEPMHIDQSINGSGSIRKAD